MLIQAYSPPARIFLPAPKNFSVKRKVRRSRAPEPWAVGPFSRMEGPGTAPGRGLRAWYPDSVPAGGCGRAKGEQASQGAPTAFLEAVVAVLPAGLRSVQVRSLWALRPFHLRGSRRESRIDLPVEAAMWSIETGGVEPAKPVTAKLRYGPGVPQGRNPTRLGVYLYCPLSGKWTWVGGVVDPNTDTITLQHLCGAGQHRQLNRPGPGTVGQGRCGHAVGDGPGDRAARGQLRSERCAHPHPTGGALGQGRGDERPGQIEPLLRRGGHPPSGPRPPWRRWWRTP